MNISHEEAARALQEIASSRASMRNAVRSHRGHLYLWIWGTVWVVISLSIRLASASPSVANWISVAGIVATVLVGFVQGQQIRSPIDRRFIAVCAALLVFGYGVWPVFMGGFHSYQAAFGYSTLLWMQVYIVAGIWFDNYWLWIGLGVTAIILAGFLFFPGYFWACTLLCGLTLIGSGIYVRFFWR
jgi:hypothetical protein